LSAPIELSIPDKPSVARLVFTNLTRDAEQEWLADGISGDLSKRSILVFGDWSLVTGGSLFGGTMHR